MDLNELLHAHQVSVMRASIAGNLAERDGHFEKVAQYAEEIRCLRNRRAQPTDDAQLAVPQAIIYASYAGSGADPEPEEAVEEWEDEGGSLDQPETELPEGVATAELRQYYVGPYIYQDLGLALAEHLRQLSSDETGGE